MSNRTIGRITREQIERWNQMTALRSREGGHIRRARPSFGPKEWKSLREDKTK